MLDEFASTYSSNAFPPSSLNNSRLPEICTTRKMQRNNPVSAEMIFCPIEELQKDAFAVICSSFQQDFKGRFNIAIF
jgi:hypothetical protein